MELRLYQTEAITKTEDAWRDFRKVLLSMPTGSGKTIVFSNLAKRQAEKGKRTLILAHRDELIRQAADKLERATGLFCGIEKAAESSRPEDLVVVGSVQSMMRENRLSRFSNSAFDYIIVDEAHRVLAESYQRILSYFANANVLGVTATPERGDKKNLGQYFEALAYEYTLRQAVEEQYLCPITAQTIPIDIDLTKVKTKQGDFDENELDAAIAPYLSEIAKHIAEKASDRKTLIFLPLIRTSERMTELMNEVGVECQHIDGKSEDRKELIQWFQETTKRPVALCNSMLLTEGYDNPSIDCIVVLRPTKSRGLYCLDEQTEILTENGWSKNVSVGELVAAFDINTEKISYTPVLSNVRRTLEPDEYFVSLKAQSTDIRITNKHRMIYDTKRNNGWRFTEAEKLSSLQDTNYIPVAGFFNGSGVPLSDDELRFIGWVMTDGTINKLNNAVTITQGEHQPWLCRIEHCLIGCGFKFNRFARVRRSQFKSSSRCICWTVSKGKPRGRDKHLRGWGTLAPWLSKELSPLLFNMTEHQFDIMIEAIHLGDGAKQTSAKGWTRRSYHICSGNKLFIERLQILALKNGYRANLALHKRQNPIWMLHLKKQNWSRVGGSGVDRPAWVREKHSDEQCWCVENAIGTIVTRRNGKVSIVGNCQMVGRGTRISEGKGNLLILDFLWHSERHALCRPAHLIAETEDIAERMVTKQNASGGGDLFDLEEEAKGEVSHEREDALARYIDANKKRKAKTIDPLWFAAATHDLELAEYDATFSWEREPATPGQIAVLSNSGFDAEGMTKGYASKIISGIMIRRNSGLATPKQLRLLSKNGYGHIENITFEKANEIITKISQRQGWNRR